MDSSSCKAKVGLLFLRDCDRPVFDNCVSCGRPVCKEHRIKGNDGTICPECASEREKYRDDDRVGRSYHRRHYYDHYGYNPYYYGHHHYYSDRDYQTFDDQESVNVDRPEGYEDNDVDDSDFDSADDAMES